MDRYEIAVINLKETKVFPYGEWSIKIFSDGMKPQLHIIKDGWDILFNIVDGKYHSCWDMGTDVEVYHYAVNEIEGWLDAPCALNGKVTNRENAMLTWEQTH